MMISIGRRILAWMTLPHRANLLKWGSWFFFCTGLVQILIGFAYLSGYSLPRDVPGAIYSVSAFTSHFIFLSYLVWLLSIFPLTILVPRRRIIVPLAIFISSMVLAWTLLDALVYADNRFHISPMIMSILGMKTWLFGLLYLCIFLCFNSFLAKKVQSFVDHPGGRRLGFPVAVVSVFLLLVTHALHIWGDANYHTPITRFSTCMPFYHPMTARRQLARFGLVNPERTRDEAAVKDMDAKSGDGLSYPLSPLVFSPPEKKLNILFVVIDGMRSDGLTQSLAPSIFAFAKRGIVFAEHFSGGNSSKMGIFSLFYGLPSTYQKHFAGTGKSPVLIDRLQKENYQFGIFGSAPLYRPTSMDRTVFSGLRNLRILTRCGINKSYARDRQINREWFSWIENRDRDRPFFGLLFYDAVTAKSYPPGMDDLFPKSEKLSGIQEQHRKHKTALRYVDWLAGSVLNDLEARGLLENTIVIITADHGTEFDDNGLGFSGHGTSYSRFQLQVPLVISWPGKPAGEIGRRTSHCDIPPTLMKEALGCMNPSSEFCSGSDIFTGPEWGWLIAGSYNNYAIVEPHQTTISYPGGLFEVRDDGYRLIPNKHLNRQVLNAALTESVRFMRGGGKNPAPSDHQ